MGRGDDDSTEGTSSASKWNPSFVAGSIKSCLFINLRDMFFYGSRNNLLV